MNLLTHQCSRRSVLLGTAGAFGLAAIAACTPDPRSGASGGGPVTIEMWTRQGDNHINEQLAAFQEAHPDIKVNLSTIDAAQYLTKLTNAARAGSVPDLIKFDIVYAPLLQAQNQLSDITDKAQALPNFSSLAEAGVSIGTLDRKIYSLPSGLSSSQMFWNKKLFRRAGLDPSKPPTTLAEVRSAAEKVQALGGGVDGFSTVAGLGGPWTNFPSVWADGGDVFTAVGPDQKATLNDPKVIAMLEWCRDMWQSGLMPKTDEPNQDPGNVGAENAAAGKVGIIFNGAFVVAGHESDFGSAPGIPGMSGNYASFLGGNSAGIPAGAKHPDEAWALMEWLTTSRKAAQIYQEKGWVGPDLSLADTVATDDWTKTTVAALKVGKLPESIAFFATVNDPSSPYYQNAQAVIFSGADAQQRMDAATEKANQLIQDAYRQLGG